ncbi:MAG: carboxypeptidase-like regulatory domain-containing protein [Prolixibacteraceae bacterium]|jgi:hypothetical protein|nr:carboxypeptidase-like regulatory domain-containing protein [Prolixibacteraceae bacterium]
MKLRPLLFIILVASPLLVLSKTITLKGAVVNKKTDEPVPFVSVAISGTYHGTVSNRSGEFVLRMPSTLKNKTITFSCIGYETYELKNPTTGNSHSIKLSPQNFQIGEITIMPDSTLRTLIRRAYRKIPDNYPDFRTRSKGFYRAAMKEYNGDYLVLTEAMLDVFKTSYKNKTTGQIKIDKSRKYIAPSIDSVNDVSFYGGHYIPHTSDLVKRRHPIVQASAKYKYKLNGYAKIDKRVLYVVHFEPSSQETEGIIGKMYIDKESLAFLKIEYRSNEEQLKWREKELFARLSSKEANKVVVYAPTNDKYYLNAASYTEKFENLKTGSILEKFSEYTLIETTPGKASLIPYNEICDYSAVIAHEATPYFESDWHDYPVTQIDEHKQMSEYVSDSIFVSSQVEKNAETKENEKIERLIKVLSILERFSFEYNLPNQTLNINHGNYALYHSAMSELLNNNLNSSNTIWQFETQISYKISKQLKIFYAVKGNLNNEHFSEAHKLGFSFILPIKPYGKQLLMTFQPSYNFQNTMLSLGETNNLIRFENGELSLKEGKSKVYWGEKSHGFDGRVTLRYEMRRRFWLNAFAGYYSQMNTQPVLRFEDKSGNLFTKKNKNIGLDESGLNLHINNIPIPKPKFELNPLYFGFGIIMKI